MLLVGTLVLAASALVLARRDGSASLVRLGYRSLLIGALPAWIVMRGAAEWIADKEGLTGDDVPSWVDLGYSIADPGLLLLLVSTVLAGLALRRAGRAEGPGGGGFSRASTPSLVSRWPPESPDSGGADAAPGRPIARQ